jgi:hypothetical protein
MTRLRAEQERGQRSITDRGKIFTPFSIQAPGSIHPLIQLAPGGGSSQGIKRQRRKAHHPLPFTAEVTYAWSYTCTHRSLHDLVLKLSTKSQAHPECFLKGGSRFSKGDN